MSAPFDFQFLPNLAMRYCTIEILINNKIAKHHIARQGECKFLNAAYVLYVSIKNLNSTKYGEVRQA